MASAAPIIAQMVIDGLISRPKQSAGRPKTEIALSVFAGLMVATGAIFVLVALRLYLFALYTAPIATLLTACAAFAAAIVACAVAGMIQGKTRKAANYAVNAAASNAEQAKDALLAALAAATEGLEEPIANNPRTSVFLASLAGYMAGDKMH